MHHKNRPFLRARRNSDRRRPNRRYRAQPSRSVGRFSTLALLGSLTAVLAGCQSFSCEESRSCGGEGGARAPEELRAEAGWGGAQAEDGAPRGCPAGYRMGEARCVDIDECAEGTHTCSSSPEVSCTNRSGGFVCGACPPGYSGGGEVPNGCVLTAPTITATSPTSGARGVAVDAPLVIVFSEAMDPTSTERAFSSDHPSLGAPAFSWNAELTELTVTPSAPYPIAEVASASDPAEAITFRFAATAADRSGEPLLEAVSGSFSAHKRVTETLLHDAATSGAVRYLPARDTYTSGSSPRAEAFAASLVANSSYARGFIGFDLGSVPDTAEVESARLDFTPSGYSCSGPVGADYWPSALVAHLARVAHPALPISTATVAELEDVYTAPVLDSVASYSAPGARSALVTSGVRRFLEDRQEAHEQLQYRLHATSQAVCGGVTFGPQHLTLVYLAE